MKPDRTPDQVRAKLARLAGEGDESLAALSRMIRRHDGYLGRFINRGVPERLPDEARAMLASYFGIDEQELGGQGSESVRVPSMFHV